MLFLELLILRSLMTPNHLQRWNTWRSLIISVMFLFQIQKCPTSSLKCASVQTGHIQRCAHLLSPCFLFSLGAQPLTGRQREHSKQKPGSLNWPLTRSCHRVVVAKWNEMFLRQLGEATAGLRLLLCNTCPQLAFANINPFVCYSHLLTFTVMHFLSVNRLLKIIRVAHIMHKSNFRKWQLSDGGQTQNKEDDEYIRQFLLLLFNKYKINVVLVTMSG